MKNFILIETIWDVTISEGGKESRIIFSFAKIQDVYGKDFTPTIILN